MYRYFVVKNLHITPEIEKAFKKKYGEKLYALSMETIEKLGLLKTTYTLHNIINTHKLIEEQKKMGKPIDHDRIYEVGELINEFSMMELTNLERGKGHYSKLPLIGRNIRFLTEKSIEHGEHWREVLADSLRWYLKIPEIPRSKLDRLIAANAQRIGRKRKIKEKLKAKAIPVNKAKEEVRRVEKNFHKTVRRIINKEIKSREVRSSRFR